MIKKLLLTTIVAIAGMAMAHGQAIVLDNGLLSRNPVMTFSQPNVMKAPMKALGENEMYMGPYTSDALATSGLGLTGLPGTYKICAFLPLDLVQNFEGGTVTKIRFGLCASVSSAAVYLIPVTNATTIATGTPVIEQNVASTTAGWNEVVIDNPYTISTEGIQGFLLGYQYKQLSGSTNACYPISAVMEGTIYDTYMYGIQGSTQWQDVGLSSYGNLSVQAVVENENFPEYDLQLNNLTCDSYADAAMGLNYVLTMSNFGIGTLTNYHIDVLIDNQKVDQLDSPVELTMAPTNYSGTVQLNGIASGPHTLTMRAVDAAGEEVTGEEVSQEFFAYTNGFPRQKQLVEQFTSQYCTYCYLGVYVLEALSNLRGDIAWVAIHGDMTSGTDIFTTNEGNQIMSYLECSGYPSASFNRHPYDGELSPGLGYNASYAQQVAQMLSDEALDANPTPALANINLSGTFDPETRQLNVTVAGDASPDFNTVFGNKVAITVYLTEDGLVAKQLSNGSWNQNYTHNHVMRDVISNSVYGDAINWTGETTYSNTFSTTLNEAWNSENMHIVAFINCTGSGNKDVINAEMIDIKDLGPEVPELNDVYILGEVNGNSWDPSVGVPMTLDNGIYTAEIYVEGETGYFSFTRMLAENSNDWDAIAPYRFTAVSEGDFIMTDELYGQPITLEEDGVNYNNAIMVPNGNYKLEINLDSRGRTLIITKLDPTAITDITTENTDNTWYNMQGMKLRGVPTAAGIYINNGKKVVIK